MAINDRVINIDELSLELFRQGDKFDTSAVRVAPLLGARQLGYSYDVLLFGFLGCTFHSHRAEEEMFFIIRGTGLLRYGNETRKLRAGDFIACPTGGPDTAHQIINDSDAPLEFISVSTMMPAEVCEYPDSGKIGAFGGSGDQRVRHMTRAESAIDYWDGEA